MKPTGGAWSCLIEHRSIWLLEVTSWAGATPGATHWRGEFVGWSECECPSLCLVPIVQWDDARTQKWLERQVEQFPGRDPMSFLRSCSRNRGGAGPGDFFDEATLVSQGVQLFADYAKKGTKLYLKEVVDGALLAEIAADGTCAVRSAGIVGLRSESTMAMLTRPYPARWHRGDGD
jgi:hypothetical protein